MTVYLDRTAKKQGFGRKIYEAMEQLPQDMGILNLYACIGYIDKEDEYLNHNSADFHTHLGYKTVGTFKKCGYKFGRWYDMNLDGKVHRHAHRCPCPRPLLTDAPDPNAH